MKAGIDAGTATRVLLDQLRTTAGTAELFLQDNDASAAMIRLPITAPT